MNTDPDDAMAGASDPGYLEDSEDEVREIFPLKFDKDFLDFRGVPEEEEEPLVVPKGWSVTKPVSDPSPPVIGMEDVSKEDLENSV